MLAEQKELFKALNSCMEKLIPRNLSELESECSPSDSWAVIHSATPWSQFHGACDILSGESVFFLRGILRRQSEGSIRLRSQIPTKWPEIVGIFLS